MSTTLFYFLCVSPLCSGERDVSLRALLRNSRWFQCKNIKIIDNGGLLCYESSIEQFTYNPNAQIENGNDLARQTHTFLSCHYALTMKDIIDFFQHANMQCVPLKNAGLEIIAIACQEKAKKNHSIMRSKFQGNR